MLRQVKLTASNDWYILTENCDSLINKLKARYYWLTVEEKRKKIPDDTLIKQYTEREGKLCLLERDIELFKSKENMINLSTKLKGELKKVGYNG